MVKIPLAGQMLGLEGGSFHVAEWTEGPCPPEGPMPVAPLHLHRECDEAWIVLSGVLTVKMGEEEIEVPEGGAILVPKGTPHTYWNAGNQPVRYLLVMTDLTKRLIDAIHASPQRDRETLVRMFQEHGSDLLE